MRWILLALCIILADGYYRDKNVIYTDDNKAITLRGINWYGAETNSFIMEGLYQYGIKDHVSNISSYGFNAIRLPLCVQGVLFEYDKQPDSNLVVGCLQCTNKTTWEMLHLFMTETLTHNMYVVVDMHHIIGARAHPLWYIPNSTVYTEEALFRAWNRILVEFFEYPNFLGMDIYNEPHGSATFGSGDMSTDWMLFTRRWIDYFFDRLWNKQESLLIFIEGIQWGQDMRKFGQALDTNSWITAKEAPYVVLSPHAYGPTLTHQLNLNDPKVMTVLENYFGYMNETQTIVVGEWGGRSDYLLDIYWMTAFVRYMHKKGLTGNFFWAWNPTSHDVKGYLLDDWITVDPWKQNIIDLMNDRQCL